MHLAFIISSLNSGGAERVLSDLANYWVSKGYQVTLVTLVSPDAKPFYPLDLKVRLIQLNQTQNESSFLTRLGNILRRVFCLRTTLNPLKPLKPEVVLSFVDVMNLTTLLASVGIKTPVIVSERMHPFYHKLPWLYHRLRTLLYPKAFRVVVQTQSAADFFKSRRNLLVIPNAVKKPSLQKITVLSQAKHIVSLGRLCPFKGFDSLIHAFSRLYPTCPHLRLTIYGEGPQRENLQKLINSLNLQKTISLPGAT
jgi:GalNAc-alpha-(1->4)-GalNAc-alpha-(1->3)-diNAcBac-PP-undecaprenol alpha-1,4-N-acetyl-D-galactosaminyltransferase